VEPALDDSAASAGFEWTLFSLSIRTSFRTIKSSYIPSTRHFSISFPAQRIQVYCHAQLLTAQIDAALNICFQKQNYERTYFQRPTVWSLLYVFYFINQFRA
jgi:hypothetical protein